MTFLGVLVAADNSLTKWQETAEFRCRNEADDAAVVTAAAKAAAYRHEPLVLAPGYYRVESCVEIPAGVTGISTGGKVYFGPRGDYGGWMMRLDGLQRAKVEGFGFNGKQQARGLLVDDCHHMTISHIHLCAVRQAVLIEKGWHVHLRTIRVESCRDSDPPLTEPLVDIRGFSMSSLRGLAIYKCTAHAPMMRVRGKASYADIAIERCESVDNPAIHFGGPGSTLERLHFEQVTAPIQVEAVDCRQCDLRAFGFGQPKDDPVKIGVQLTRCEQTNVSGVLATFCRDALVRLDLSSGLTCKVDRLGFYYDRSDRKHLPRHIVDWVGREATTGSQGPKHLVDFAGKGK